jgi:hypothetical protein
MPKRAGLWKCCGKRAIGVPTVPNGVSAAGVMPSGMIVDRQRFDAERRRGGGALTYDFN